jgi:hypothetical protein
MMTKTETASIASTLEVATTTHSAEAQLTIEIAEMWRIHTQAHTSLHKTRAELKQIRAEFSRRLHELKSVLSRPGRGGAWSGFLESQQIPRSTADRLVRGYEKTIAAEGENCTSEQIPESTDVLVRRYFSALWPRLSRILTTPESIEMFVVELRRTADKSFGVGAEAPSESSTPQEG